MAKIKKNDVISEEPLLENPIIKYILLPGALVVIGVFFTQFLSSQPKVFIEEVSFETNSLSQYGTYFPSISLYVTNGGDVLSEGGYFALIYDSISNDTCGLPLFSSQRLCYLNFPIEKEQKNCQTKISSVLSNNRLKVVIDTGNFVNTTRVFFSYLSAHKISECSQIQSINLCLFGQDGSVLFCKPFILSNNYNHGMLTITD